MRRYGFLVLALVVAVSGCDRSKAKLEAALAEQQVISAQKDSLMTEILETSKFVADVNTELAKVKGLEGSTDSAEPGVPGAERDREQRQTTLAKIQTVIARLDEKEQSLAKSEARIKELARRDSRLAKQVAEYKQSLADLRTAMQTQEATLMAVIDSQKTEIATLAGRVDTLSTEKVALQDTVSQLTTARNTAYYAIGTKNELKEQGVVTQEGSKFLFFGGTQLHPSRNPDPASFIKVDVTRDSVIPLPKPDKKYKIVSRQSQQYLDSTTVTRDGKVQGEVRIANPEAFWSASKYLILVED